MQKKTIHSICKQYQGLWIAQKDLTKTFYENESFSLYLLISYKNCKWHFELLYDVKNNFSEDKSQWYLKGEMEFYGNQNQFWVKNLRINEKIIPKIAYQKGYLEFISENNDTIYFAIYESNVECDEYLSLKFIRHEEESDG